MTTITVVKVGGSLYDHPRLAAGLRRYLRQWPPQTVRLVPGGGDLADAVRKYDRIHHLGEQVAHRLAMRTLAVAGELLAMLLGTDCPPIVTEVDLGDWPHTWALTSDSIAARVAWQERAERLILLKSVTIPEGTSWVEAAARGWVDAFFPQAVAQAPFVVHAVPFRRFLDQLE